ncbi:MAG: copper-binding protein [Polyangiaceae bacterium]
MKTTLLSLVLAATVATTLACNKSQASPSGDPAQPSAPSQGGKVYETRGVIKAFGEGKKSVKISHEDVPGYMKAMTMPFAVKEPAVLDGLAEGDAVTFSFTEESDGRLLIQSIKKR